MLSEAISRFLDVKRETLRSSTVDQYETELNHWKRDHTLAWIIMCRAVQPEHVKAYVYGTDKDDHAIRNATPISSIGIPSPMVRRRRGEQLRRRL